jgi:acetolactate decarboxylase
MKEATPEGSLAMVKPVWHHLSPAKDQAAGELYQTSLMTALLEGLYEGDVTYGEVRRHGDFGLGTFNDLDGEMVGFDGIFYQLRSDGSAHVVDPEQKTPFAVVTFFKPETEVELPDKLSKQEVLGVIEKFTDANLFTAVRIDGLFEEVRTRTVELQKRPFPPLTEATAHQDVKSFINVRGTLAGFRTPAFAQGIGVAGFHLHFLREDKQAGGHALEYVVRQGKLRLAPLHGFHVELPRTEDFRTANLQDGSLDSKIKASEG